MKTKRSYTMSARAAAVEDTRARIQTAMLDLGQTQVFTDISLDDVAREAGVSVQTVLRHFGSRAHLIEVATDYALEQIARERETPVGDIDAAMAVLMEHYELRGNSALLMLSQEARDAQAGRITERGREMHRTWVAEAFGPYVDATADPAATVDLLVVATDVYTWKLLRKDRRLSRSRTQERMTALVDAVLAHRPRPSRSQ